MPAPTTSPRPTALAPLPALAVHARFATRPALYSVVFNALRGRILAQYPSLKLDLRAVKLASPDPSGHYTYTLLMEVAVAHILNPQLLDLRARRERPYFLTQEPPKILKPDTLPLIDMQVIAQIIDELPASLYLHFQHDLADYWSTLDSHGSSRWQWLSEWLNGQMTAAAAGPSGLTETQRDMLAVTAAWPGRLERLPRSKPTTYAYFIETTLSKAGKEVCLLTPDLLLVRDTQVLLCSVAGAVEPFDCIDAFGDAWGSRMQRQFQCDSITWRRNEPEDNVFEQQAELILNQQIEDLATVSFQGQDEVTLGRALEKLTDPALLFTQGPMAPAAHLHKVNAQLPAWLKQANADDRFAYHRHLQDMARVIKQNAGRSFNEGIDNIHTFSRDALRKQMQTDHEDYDPDDLVLDFAVAAGYPGGAGIIEHVRMSLTELALKNLSGKPKGTLTLSSNSARTLPSWMNEDYLLGSQGLIQRVDIGTAYPQKIKDLLLSDTRDARQRETLFTRELKVQLPMLALEYAIRQQYGVTTTGYRYVKALMGETPTDRVVDGQEIVLRPLGLCRKAGATPDTVNTIFVIEPRDASIGPHLLYRPLYTQALSQYPTRQALLEALATPGALQDSVLTWLPDKARPLYDNGGFKEPHIIRFLPGDEFSLPEKPAPATLAVDESADEWLQSQINGKLLSHLFGSTARAMVDLADRESVSNSESRWAIVMEGAWLLFNTLLLPLVRGPAMLVGWFLVLVSSLEQDLAGLDSNDSTTRELALIDLLLNTAMVLLHAASGSDRTRQPLAELAPQDSALHLKAWRRTAGLTQQEGTARTQQGSVALPGEPPATGHTPLDFSRSLASPQASAKLLKALLEIHVPWPDALPPPEARGRLKGLYNINTTWHASVGGLLFQVSVVPGFGEVYLVDPQHPQHPGFRLTSDSQGHWRLEQRVRLEGGMPRERLSGWQRNRNERLKDLNQDLAILNTEASGLAPLAQQFNDAVTIARTRLTKCKSELREDWERLNSPTLLPALRPRIAERHEQRQHEMVRAKTDWNTAVDNYQENTQAFICALEKSAVIAGELMELDRTQPQYKQTRDNATENIFKHLLTSYASLHHKIRFSLESQRGESLAELLRRTDSELPDGLTDGYEAFIHDATQRLETLKEILTAAEKIEALLHKAPTALREQLVAQLPPERIPSSVSLKQHQLLSLSELIVNRALGAGRPEERPFLDVLVDRKANAGILAHTEIRTTSGYSPAEQIDVLKDVSQQYERLENAVNTLTEMGSVLLREPYRAPFLEQLGQARASLEAQLASLILVEEKIAPKPAADKTKRPKKPNRRVIKTLDNQNLIGDLRPSQPEAPGNFVDIQDPLTGQTLATYHEHAHEGGWQIVEPVRAPVQVPVRSLKAIKAQAQTIQNERAAIDASIRFQQRKLQDPSRLEGLDPHEWDVMLSQHAAKFEALADEIQRNHATDANALSLQNSYRDQAHAAIQKAREVCSEGYKLQRPRATNVDYLWTHGFVDINLVKTRTPLKAGGYLTEYAIRDKNKIKPGEKDEKADMWYAHFHYTSVDAPALAPDFGHLKTKEERRYTRKELIERAGTNHRTLINLDKAVIKAPLDQKLFLHLEQPEPRETPTA
ncbi:dermonecrotic toxin domain-containing protein [Pseudomonas antarctica]|uniref:dermonecrotic toxin domain-containing protein n=2 Tax=Pseudomonas antarctica TaxID=219572 RepID=UPI0039C374D9